MLPTKPLFFLLLLPFFFFLSSTFSQSSHGLQLFAGGDDINSVVLLRINERSVLEGSNDENSSLILAEKRTRRKDPSNDFKYYTGGWNISNDHYISSVAFSAAPLFAIAAIWFVGFGLSLLLICCCYCCCPRRPYGYSRTAYALSLVFLALFTIAAITGCVVLYTGQGKFNDSTTDTLDYVVSQSTYTVANLNNVSAILATAKGIGVDQISLPSNIKNNIDRVDKMINSASTNLDHETKKNQKNIKDALDAVRLALIIIAAVMLLVAILGFLLSILGLQVLVSFLVILGWILVTATFILCGIFLVLHNVMGDTCVAMHEWVQNPTAHTALDDILPCVDNATAQETLTQSKDVTYQLVVIVNSIINNVSNLDPSLIPGFLNYNQSGPLVPTLCNPLNADKTDRKCVAGEVDFQNATQVWANYVCQVSADNICTNIGRLTPKMYDQMSSAVNVSSGLNHYGPFLAGLLDCSFVRDTFTGVHKDHCPDLTEYSRWVYIGLAMVSTAVMLSLVFWVLYARERRHRKYSKLAVAASAQNSFAK